MRGYVNVNELTRRLALAVRVNDNDWLLPLVWCGRCCCCGRWTVVVAVVSIGSSSSIRGPGDWVCAAVFLERVRFGFLRLLWREVNCAMARGINGWSCCAIVRRGDRACGGWIDDEDDDDAGADDGAGGCIILIGMDLTVAIELPLAWWWCRDWCVLSLLRVMVLRACVAGAAVADAWL